MGEATIVVVVVVHIVQLIIIQHFIIQQLVVIIFIIQVIPAVSVLAKEDHHLALQEVLESILR